MSRVNMSQVNARPGGAAGTLHVVATPIGNLDDLSRRAVDVLSSVAIIAAEDTRRARTLLGACGIESPELVSLHEHSETRATKRVVAALEAGSDVALISDAGTPLLSDPGFVLLRECHGRTLPVRPVPGPSALACVLSVCPLPTHDFRFLGFLPARAAQRRTRLERAAADGPVVFFEAPHRMAGCLADVAAVAPGRRVFVGREMTKRFESYLCAEPDALARVLEEGGQLRGEFAVVLEGPNEAPATTALGVRETMTALCRELKPAQAVRLGAELLGQPRCELYELAVQLRER